MNSLTFSKRIGRPRKRSLSVARLVVPAGAAAVFALLTAAVPAAAGFYATPAALEVYVAG